MVRKGFDILKKHVGKGEDTESSGEGESNILEGMPEIIGKTNKNLGAKIKEIGKKEETETPYATELPEQEITEEKEPELTNEEFDNNIEGNFLGKPVVMVEKVLNKIVKVGETEIHTALVDKNGDQLVAGVDPDYLDYRTVKEGDLAVYEEKNGSLLKVIDSVSPLIKTPKVSFDLDKEAEADPSIQVIGGLEEQIKLIKEALKVFDKKEREKMVKFDIPPVRAILLYGPSGTGKTMLAKASANYISKIYNQKCSFFFKNTPEFFKSHLGKTTQEIKRFFTAGRKAAPSILYLDEVTRLASFRSYEDGGAEREVAGATEEFQAQMNGLNNNGLDGEYTLVMASTNLEEIFDPAVLGRFDLHIKVPLPDFETKKKIVKRKVERIKTGNLPIQKIAEKIENINPNASGRHIEDICNYAKRRAFYSENILSYKHFEEALDQYSKRVDVKIGRN